MSMPGTALAGTPVANGTALQGRYDNASTDYNQYSFRVGDYVPGANTDSTNSNGAYVSIGIYAFTGVNKTDDAIFGLNGYNLNGRGGGVALGDSATVTGETGIALGAHSTAS
ncbi:hypothetical protein, partial [Paraburkholderia sp. J63]|uniref:hypothetical protein n=1 Tax=Paraburkholderia sp. J63 TaxID=2805434 RepID=UPI002ABE7C0C